MDIFAGKVSGISNAVAQNANLNVTSQKVRLGFSLDPDTGIFTLAQAILVVEHSVEEKPKAVPVT